MKIVENIKMGNPLSEATQMGPLCTLGQIENIAQELEMAKSEGGEILCGGDGPSDLSQYFFRPTIVACPRQSLKIVDTELFGPVLSVLTFSNEGQVIDLANDTKHGLAAGIFTDNSARSMRVAKKIRAGIIWINTYRAVSPIAQFGGFKGSGYGRESGFQAMYDYTRPKTIWFNTSNEPMANPFIMR